MDGAVAAAAGGAVLGAATMLKLAVNGNILGISGIVNGVCSNLVSRDSSPWFWRVVFASTEITRQSRRGSWRVGPPVATAARRALSLAASRLARIRAISEAVSFCAIGVARRRTH